MKNSRRFNQEVLEEESPTRRINRPEYEIVSAVTPADFRKNSELKSRRDTMDASQCSNCAVF